MPWHGPGRTRRCTPSTSGARSSAWADRSLKARAYLRQVAGAVGGWSSSLRQHVHGAEPPQARFLATMIVGMGGLTGQVPRDVRQHLRHGPFRDFCLFNVDAELTARRRYERMLELAPEVPELSSNLVDDLRRSATTRIGTSTSSPSWPRRSTRRTVSRRGDARRGGPADRRGRRRFPPRALRPSLASHPLGAGGRVWVVAGDSPEAKRPLFRRLLDDAGLEERLRDRERALGRPAGACGGHQADLHARLSPQGSPSNSTDPELLADLAERLHEARMRRGRRRGAQHL